MGHQLISFVSSLSPPHSFDSSPGGCNPRHTYNELALSGPFVAIWSNLIFLTILVVRYFFFALSQPEASYSRQQTLVFFKPAGL